MAANADRKWWVVCKLSVFFLEVFDQTYVYNVPF